MWEKFMLKHGNIYKFYLSFNLDKLHLKLVHPKNQKELLEGQDKPSMLDYPEGFRMKLEFNGDDLTDYDYLREWRISKLFETKTTNYVKKFLKQGDSFIDGGANIGYYSLMASKLVGQKGSVYAFEPTPATFKRLCDNISLNELQNVKPYQMGLGSDDGELEYFISNINPVNNSFVKSELNSHPGSNVIKVKIARLDTIFPDGIDNLSVIKLDVEGYENEVILGAKNLIQKSRPAIIFEFYYPIVVKRYKNHNQIFDSLKALGYSEFIEIETGNIVSKYSDLSHTYTNVIASR
jgi:FkbM family methyltransferase